MIYLLVALICLALSHRPFWRVMAGVLVVLGLCRLADIQVLMTDVGRQLAYADGWYSVRRPLQAAGILGILLSTGLVITWLRPRLQRLQSPEAAALLCMMALCALIAVRVVSLHQIDRLLGIRLLGVQLGWLAEVAALGGIAATALWQFVRAPRLA